MCIIDIFEIRMPHQYNLLVTEPRLNCMNS
ncbi:hypothetical protein F383_34337 [Gossypium arboreum]|uniref:Uncharacterized protein n=1 Tax=Gossypium arboreum TaxID=29729 RepID=A0A0B0N4M2_GOSAR|nr:hypothetical protein F383_34337 [Gossypium arboreum]